VRDESPEEIGALTGQPERNRRAKRVTGHSGWREAQVLDQCREIGNVLTNAPLAGWTLTFAVAATVISEHAT